MRNNFFTFNQKTYRYTCSRNKNSTSRDFEVKMNTQLTTFSFHPPINLVEEDKWLLSVTSFEATNSVFNITGENNSSSIFTPAHWSSQNAEETLIKLNNLLNLGSEKDLDLHINEVKKRGNIIILDGQECTKKIYNRIIIYQTSLSTILMKCSKNQI